MRGSPRTLGDRDILIRFGLLNLVAVIANRIQKGALRTGEFLSDNNGWSFVWTANKADAERKTKKHSAQKSKEAGREKIYGYATITVGELRSITDSAGRPALRVVATPSKNIPDHITIFRARDYTEKEAEKIRAKLLNLLSDVVVPK